MKPLQNDHFCKDLWPNILFGGYDLACDWHIVDRLSSAGIKSFRLNYNTGQSCWLIVLGPFLNILKTYIHGTISEMWIPLPASLKVQTNQPTLKKKLQTETRLSHLRFPLINLLFSGVEGFGVAELLQAHCSWAIEVKQVWLVLYSSLRAFFFLFVGKSSFLSQKQK